MLRLLMLFRRYQMRHVTLEADATHLQCLSLPGTRIRNLRLGQGQLQLAISTTARHVALSLGEFSDDRRLNGTAETVVDLSLPATPRSLLDDGPLLLSLDGRDHVLPLPSLRRGIWRARVAFARDIARSLPVAAAWFATRKPHYRQQVKRRLRLSPFVPMQLLQPGFQGQPARATQSITILMPVYNALEVLTEALDRVVRHTDLPWHMVLVDDCSTDARVRPLLRAWAAEQGDHVTVLENECNLGFVASINCGFSHILGQIKDESAVILLNSDAMVPQDWAARLTGPLADALVATVTPMSNDAEILSVPQICVRGDLAPDQAARIDARAAMIGAQCQVELPTGVGFCMAIARPWLRRVGEFDPVFGRGYGEEVDFCQRLRRMGGRNIGLPGLFVEHRGGQSFGSAAKARLIAQNGAIISRRYPHFDQDVQDFIAADPLATPRMALALAWAASLPGTGPLPVYLAHSQGGGADRWLEKHMAEDLARGQPSVVLRVGGVYEWQLELVTADAPVCMVARDFAVIGELLRDIGPKRIIYSNGVGAVDEAALPSCLLALAAPDDQVEMLFHDYFPLSPSYTLLDSDNCYRGLPGPDHADPAHMHRAAASGRMTGLAEWRQGWRALAERADRLVVFSQSSARILSDCWPDLSERITVEAHAMLAHVPRLAPAATADACPVIAVLGNLSVQKGLHVVDALGAMLRRDPVAGLVLIGDFDPAFPPPSGVTVHGAYRVEDLEKIVRRYGITHWLIPSIWPETFSFTVNEALATGLPVLAFDIGAQGDTVRARPNGHPMPFDNGADLAGTVFSTFLGLQHAKGAKRQDKQT